MPHLRPERAASGRNSIPAIRPGALREVGEQRRIDDGAFLPRPFARPAVERLGNGVGVGRFHGDARRQSQRRRLDRVVIDEEVDRREAVPAGQAVQGEVLDPDAWMKQLGLMARHQEMFAVRIRHRFAAPTHVLARPRRRFAAPRLVNRPNPDPPRRDRTNATADGCRPVGGRPPAAAARPSRRRPRRAPAERRLRSTTGPLVGERAEGTWRARDAPALAGFGFGGGDHAAVIGQAFGGVVEHAAEGPLRIEVEPRHAHFFDAKPGRAACTQSCKGMPQPVSVMCSLASAFAAVGLEAAEGVGQTEAEVGVEFRRDLPVDVTDGPPAPGNPGGSRAGSGCRTRCRRRGWLPTGPGCVTAHAVHRSPSSPARQSRAARRS